MSVFELSVDDNLCVITTSFFLISLTLGSNSKMPSSSLVHVRTPKKKVVTEMDKFKAELTLPIMDSEHLYEVEKLLKNDEGYVEKLVSKTIHCKQCRV